MQKLETSILNPKSENPKLGLKLNQGAGQCKSITLRASLCCHVDEGIPHLFGVDFFSNRFQAVGAEAAEVSGCRFYNSR